MLVLKRCVSVPALGQSPGGSLAFQPAWNAAAAQGEVNATGLPRNLAELMGDLDPQDLLWPAAPAAWEMNRAEGWHRGALTWDTALFAQTSVGPANATVVACVSAASPVLSLNATQNCSTGMRDAGTRCQLRALPLDLVGCPLTRDFLGCPREADFSTNPSEVFVLACAQRAGVHRELASTKGRSGYQLGLFQPCWQEVWGWSRHCWCAEKLSSALED